MGAHLYKIELLTNLHAGSGDSGGYGVVDKTVQRDHTSELPTIFASSLKGALREHFRGEEWEISVFGSEPSSRDEKSVQPGSHTFLSADLLALPNPVDQSPFYELVTDETYIKDLELKYSRFFHSDKTPSIAQGFVIPEDKNLFKDLANDLPVIARNQLKNGESKNLWYEEVVSRASVFVACIMGPNNSELFGALDLEPIIQIGANASVGYGYCKFKKVTL